jgi:membrane-bound lytic murein transglycosylase D
MKSKKHILIYGTVAVLMTLSSAFIIKKSNSFDSETTFIYRNYDSELTASKKDYPKAPYDFCGERMPSNQAENYKKLNREIRQFLAYPNGLKQLFRRADKHLPTIEKRLAKCGLPEDLKYIPMIESRFLNDTSSKGAQGYWQFMPQTAIQYGLIVSDSLDERLDERKSTRAACNYLNQMHSQLKTWTLTAAAYNVGLGKVDRNIHHSDKLYPNYYTEKWNPETAEYIFKLMAIKQIYENRDFYRL